MVVNINVLKVQGKGDDSVFVNLMNVTHKPIKLSDRRSGSTCALYG